MVVGYVAVVLVTVLVGDGAAGSDVVAVGVVEQIVAKLFSSPILLLLFPLSSSLSHHPPLYASFRCPFA